MTSMAEAYSRTGASWQAGPGRIYDRLARELVAASPVPLTGRRVLDVGAGTGAGSRAAAAVGAHQVVAIDNSVGIVVHAPTASVAGDALALPFRDGSFDAALAGFSLNHLDDPATGMRELVRITASRSPLLIATYADDDSHPVKQAVEAALVDRGWRAEPWYVCLRKETMTRLATVERCAAVATASGLDADVVARRVPFPDLEPADLVEWRLGMAQHAPFVLRLDPHERAELVSDALRRLGEAPRLERSVIFTIAVTR